MHKKQTQNMHEKKYAVRSKKADIRRKKIKAYIPIYLLFLPILIYFIIYRYYPMVLQTIMAFQDYSITGGIADSPWVGLKHFEKIFTDPEMLKVIGNTFYISFLRLIAGILPPLILAIMLFDLSSNKLRKIGQTILYIPHFFSWVIIYALMYSLFSGAGIITRLINAAGGNVSDFFLDSSAFLPLLISSGLWKELGWGTIVYLAALTSIDPALFEAAKVDGAGPIKRIFYITIPSILPIIVFLVIISIGNIMKGAGGEQILLFYTPATYDVADVIDTWLYRAGLGQMQYSLGAAMSFFQSVLGLILVLLANKLSIKLTQRGIV